MGGTLVDGGGDGVDDGCGVSKKRGEMILEDIVLCKVSGVKGAAVLALELWPYRQGGRAGRRWASCVGLLRAFGARRSL